MSAHSPRVKSYSHGALVSPGLGLHWQGSIKAPTLTWGTNLKSDGSSRKQSNCRFICYFYYLTSPYIFSQLPPLWGEVGVLSILLLLPGPPASQVFVITYFFIGFLGPVTRAPETPPPERQGGCSPICKDFSSPFVSWHAMRFPASNLETVNF